MKEIEREVSYCFDITYDVDTISQLLTNIFDVGFQFTLNKSSYLTIYDHYINKNIRIREEKTVTEIKIDTKYYLQRKEGNKETERIEYSNEIQKQDLENLKSLVQLVVKKNRHTYNAIDLSDDFNIMVDYISSPIKVTMVEVELKETSDEILLFEKIKKNCKYSQNNKSAWDYFNRQIALTGAPSSGKSTLAREITNKLGIEYNAEVEHISEYARTFISRYGAPSFLIQPLIEWGQTRREDDCTACSFVTDSPTFLPYIYTAYYGDGNLTPQGKFLLSKMYKGALHGSEKYTDIFLLEPRPLIKDGTRYQTQEDIDSIHKFIKNFLDLHHIPYTTIESNDIDIDSIIRQIYNINIIE